MNPLLHDNGKYYKKVFLLALLVGAAAFLPFVIYDKGFFFYYGDFNVQQIPFYMHAHDMVRSGSFGWDWLTDLGANFTGSYSFYLLFSPFFWLTIPFPTAFLPHLMAPLLVLKSACAALTGYAYISRFLRDRDTAVVAALLYAFSGFSVYNIFFNHFHEAIVFFPLLLIGLEEAMTSGKYGRFAVGVAVNAIVNYWFFIGEAVFTAIYFFVRLFSSTDWKLTAKKFFSLASEVLLGMGLAMFAFLPSVLAIMGNPRTGADSILNGTGLWYYSNPQRYLGILHAIFFSPDLPALNNMFPDHGAQWSSLAAYLPVFGAAGTLAYFRMRRCRRDWLRNLLAVCFIMAMVPLGNHLFVLLNNSYYTRWFYMPTLLLCLATGRAFQRTLSDPDDHSLEFGLKLSGAAIGLLLVISGLTPKLAKEGVEFGIYKYIYMFLGTSAITVLGFAAAVLWCKKLRRGPKARQQLYAILLVGCFLFTFGCMLIGKISYHNNRWITEAALPGRGQMSMSAQGVYERCDIYEGDDNIGMYWDLPNIQCFHSIIPVSVMEFYPEVGVKRDVSSKPDSTLFALRDLLSVRWLYIGENEELQDPMPGYDYVDNRNGYNIYENTNYIPMGFAYDNYLDGADWENIGSDLRSRALVHAVYLEDDAIERNADILTNVDDEWRVHLTTGDIAEQAALRREAACDSFIVTKTGFTARSSYESDRLVFFSVPWDKGWSAEINGEPTIIERASLGFMAVRAPAGESEIVFTYRTPGAAVGGAVSALSVLLLAFGVWLNRKKRAARPALGETPLPDAERTEPSAPEPATPQSDAQRTEPAAPSENPEPSAPEPETSPQE